MVELLSPVGDLNCAKAAVQNGADSIYLGLDNFSARAFAANFSLKKLENVIEYCKIRGVKTYLTLNTLLKNSEFTKALEFAKCAYEYGIDGIIVQDLGLAMALIKNFKDLPIHGSTQMTVHNLNGALELEKLGFKRVVLSRELTINDIDYICKNTKLEIETFIHGALCISYSGQCLFSSMLGGRSGNRGKCAGPCRLPFDLIENNKKIDSGYLLNTRDLCALEYIPSLVKAGVKCFKIEGRMKNPEYVATVTRIYRKYIDLALSSNEYKIDPQDLKDLLQVFNRGMASPGHLSSEGNKKLVYKDAPGNTGLFLGKIQKYNPKKGYVTVKLNEPIEIGDTVSLLTEKKLYTVSELMDQNFKNISETNIGKTVVIGRVKGNICLGDKIYKMSSKKLNDKANSSFNKDYKKIGLSCEINIKKNMPISLTIKSANNLLLYKDLSITYKSNFTPVEAINRPINKDTIKQQLSKTNDTIYEFKKIRVNLDDGLFIPSFSIINDIRRNSLKLVEEFAIRNTKRVYEGKNLKEIYDNNVKKSKENSKNGNIKESENICHKKISLLLNILNLKLDYSYISKVDYLYIPLKYFSMKNFENIISTLTSKFKTYIYMPTIIKSNYKNLFIANIHNTLEKYHISGFVISNICNIKLLDDLFKTIGKKYEVITNYTFNVFNQNTIQELKNLKISRYTISPELDKKAITELANNTILPSELIVYGKTPLLNMNYCLLGQTDKCYPTCLVRCENGKTYYLSDRLNLKFRILPDNIQTVTTIFNSKTLSIPAKSFDIDVARIDILDENIDQINAIIEKVKSGNRFEGKEYTNGNLNREI